MTRPFTAGDGAQQSFASKAFRIAANLALEIEDLRAGVVKRGKGWTAQTRETLEDEMRRSGYRPIA